MCDGNFHPHSSKTIFFPPANVQLQPAPHSRRAYWPYIPSGFVPRPASDEKIVQFITRPGPRFTTRFGVCLTHLKSCLA